MAYLRHDIIETEGIGEQRAAQLRSIGIYATEDLLVMPFGMLTTRVQELEGFPVRSLVKYRAMAGLMQIPGVDGQFAEALYKSGAGTTLRVAAPTAEGLQKRINALHEQGDIPEPVDLTTVAEWQKNAIRLRFTGCVAGVVKHGEAPVAEASVHCHNETATSDSHGRFHLPYLPNGAIRLVVRAEGYQRAEVRVDTSAAPLVFRKVLLTQGDDTSTELDESQGQPITAIAPDDRIRFVETPFTDVADGAYLQFQALSRNGSGKFFSVNRKKVGNEIRIARVLLPPEQMPDKLSAGKIYRKQGGGLVPGNKSLRQIRCGEFMRRTAAAGQKAPTRIVLLPAAKLADGMVFRIAGRSGDGRLVSLVGIGRRDGRRVLPGLFVADSDLADEWPVGSLLVFRSGQFKLMKPVAEGG